MLIDKLIEKIKICNNPTVIGLDPKIDLIPKFILDESYEIYGHTLEAVSNAFLNFNKKIIDSTYDLVPAVKPQVAMYEQYGFYGIKAYIDTIAYAKSKDLIVIGDVKRGDIQSTAEAYSDGHIGKVIIKDKEFSVYDEDFITLNPYLGSDSITPYLSNCSKYDKGIFVLVKTSNPGSADFQNLLVDNKPIYKLVGEKVSDWGKNLIGKYGFSNVCAVVGATHKKEAEELRQMLPNTFFLIPGYGAQGGKAEDLKVCFNQDGLGGIVNSSRGIIAAYKLDKYKNSFKPNEFELASRQATLDMKADLLNYITGF